jgi:hypothetical protein
MLAQSNYWKARVTNGNLEFRYSDGKGEVAAGELERIIADLAQAMPGYNPPQYFASQPGIFTNYAHLVIASECDSGRAVGLLGSRWFKGDDLTFLYLWTGMVAERAQKQELLQQMFFLLLDKALETNRFPPAIAAKTYSPLWYKVMQRLTAAFAGARLYPVLNGIGQEPDMVELARQVHRQLTPTLTMRTDVGVILGAQAVVGPDFFPPVQPRSGDRAIDGHFQTHVTREDQVLTIIDTSRTPREAVEAMLAQARKRYFGGIQAASVHGG